MGYIILCNIFGPTMLDINDISNQDSDIQEGEEGFCCGVIKSKPKIAQEVHKAARHNIQAKDHIHIQRAEPQVYLPC